MYDHDILCLSRYKQWSGDFVPAAFEAFRVF